MKRSQSSQSFSEDQIVSVGRSPRGNVISTPVAESGMTLSLLIVNLLAQSSDDYVNGRVVKKAKVIVIESDADDGMISLTANNRYN